jgi:hypothetical protein
MSPRLTTETLARSVEIPQIDCTGFGVVIREELAQKGDETIVVSRTVRPLSGKTRPL